MKPLLRTAAALLFSAAIFVPAADALRAAENPAAVPAITAAEKLDLDDIEKFSGALENFWEMPLETALSTWNFGSARWEKAASPDETKRAVHSAWLFQREIFGVPAAQVKIEEEQGKPARIEIMFFNKGDSASEFGIRRKTQEEKEAFVKKNWRDGAEAVADALAPLGKARSCAIGAGKLRRRAEVREHGGNAFFLDAEKLEYVRIVIVPASRAQELTATTAAERVKGNFSVNTERRENGDVLIGNIPMINQGGKGYCVPATVERVLRYFGAENLDMHKIAELAGTGAGGGTTMPHLVRGISPVLKRQKLAFSTAKMSFGKIRQFTDKGIPMLWLMYSVDVYRDRLKETTQKRADEKDFSAWAKKLNAMKKLDLSGANLREHAHVCLIIGYNAKTKEICVSDSWGRGAEEEWIRFEDALAVSQAAPLYVLKN